MEEQKRPDFYLISPDEFRKHMWSPDGIQFVLGEMIRLGFWPGGQEITDSPEEMVRMRELHGEIDILRKEIKKYGNEKKNLNKIRNEMFAVSKKRRAEKKALKVKEKEEKKKIWEEKKKDLLLYSGEGVSGGLSNTEYDKSRLESLGLPLITSPLELAQYLSISISKLKWLTYHRDCTTICHYNRFSIPKKTGGKRNLSSPKPLLKSAQNWIKEHILDKIDPQEHAHGFIKNRSIISNGEKHVNSDMVINIDLKDFFPSIGFKRVKGMFESFGYSEVISILLSLLCTEPPRETVSYEGKIYNVSLGARQVPQGASTSPSITNIICRRLDRRLSGKAESLGFVYTRYADDMTFSCSSEGKTKIGKLLSDINSIITFEGFEIHPQKTRVFHKSRRQEVTGLVVNHKISIAREDIKRFRAILHNCKKYGIESQNKENHPNFIASLRGYCSFISMVDSEKGGKFLQEIEEIVRAKK